MTVYEFGKENKKTMLMFQCSAEPVMVHPSRFYEEATRFLNGSGGKEN